MYIPTLGFLPIVSHSEAQQIIIKIMFNLCFLHARDIYILVYYHLFNIVLFVWDSQTKIKGGYYGF